MGAALTLEPDPSMTMRYAPRPRGTCCLFWFGRSHASCCTAESVQAFIVYYNFLYDSGALMMRDRLLATLQMETRATRLKSLSLLLLLLCCRCPTLCTCSSQIFQLLLPETGGSHKGALTLLLILTVLAPLLSAATTLVGRDKPPAVKDAR